MTDFVSCLSMRYPCFFVFIFLLLYTYQQAMAQPKTDWQGHRGCRGLMPENTMPAFLKAVELGASTLEFDIVISADRQIVVSHEPWMSHVICSHPDGKPVKKSEAKKINLYKMDYNAIQQFDCGQRGNPDFPSQQQLKAVKPTLKMVIRSVERFAMENKYSQPKFNIEIKSDPGGYNTYVPEPKEFVALVMAEIQRLGIEDQVTLQSFDINVLEELNKQPERKFMISYLVKNGKNIPGKMEKLTFKPDIYSPNYKKLKEELVKQAHDLGMKIIPWTVNTVEEMNQLIAWGVDGIITDYPDLASAAAKPGAK